MIRFDENVSYSAIILKTSMIFDEKELTQDFENLKSMQDFASEPQARSRSRFFIV